MKRTDYGEVSARYDENEIRKRIARDDAIDALMVADAGRAVRVLDVACGTGNYLAVQAAAFVGASV
ncbi:MAG TPA: hypothetical protein VHB21_06845, partial [Minicystis sp.]|nr:hypothetical protein [Minicystis sp.]